MQAIVKKSKTVLGRRGKCEAVAVSGQTQCLGCNKFVRVLWREWYGWKVTPAVCSDCCKELFESIERGAKTK